MLSRRCVARRCLDRRELLECDVRVTKILEHPRACSEKHRHDLKRELVEQAGCEALLTGSGAAHYRDVLVAGPRTGFLEDRDDAAGNEVVDAAGRRLVGHAVRHDEHRGRAGPPATR
jgi:hypothetical protein